MDLGADRNITQRKSVIMVDTPDTIISNSYKLRPDDDRKFSVMKSRPLLENVLKDHLEEFEYDAVGAGDKCKEIVDDVLTTAKTLECDRYRFVSHAAMFTNVGQTVKSVGRFLWDQTTDNHVTCKYVGSNFSVVLTLYAVYFE